MDEKTTYLLAAAILAVIIAVPGTYLTSVYLVPHPAEIYTPSTVISQGFFVPGFRTETTPVNSYPYGYRLCQENYSIVTVGATANNASEQSASITSHVTRQTSNIILIVTFQANTVGDSCAIWTKASSAGKLSLITEVSAKNSTQQVTLPFSYTTDGKVYWQMNEAHSSTKVTIMLWGYFETQQVTIH